MEFKKVMVVLILLNSLIACSLTDPSGLGEYKSETITVENPEFQTELLSSTQYSIDSICSLSMPENIKNFYMSDFTVKNNKVYLMDERFSNTILAFDSNGKFLYRAGERGRARNEYIEGPTIFFVDNRDYVHVFEYRSQKILVFDNEGKYTRTIRTREVHPWSIGMTGNGRYMYSFLENTCGAALAVCDDESRIQKTLIPFKQKYVYLPTKICFYQNGNRLSHIPLLSDSIMVFNNDKLEKVVKVDFKGKFIMDNMPEGVIDVEKPLDFHGIRSIRDYQETDSLIYLRYDYGALIRSMLINKTSKKILTGLSFFDGISPFTDYYLLDNKIAAYVSDENVDMISSRPRDEKFMDAYNKSHPKIKEIIDGKIKTPVIVYISLK